MINIPDFSGSALTRQWRAAFDKLGRPPEIPADKWAEMVDLSQHAAASAMETFYRIAISSRNVWVASNTIMNGAELAKLLIDNIQDAVRSLHGKEGGQHQSTAFVVGPNGPEQVTTQ